MNLAPIADAAITLASAVATACIPVAVAYLARKAGVDKDTAMRDSLSKALQRGVGVALAAGQAAGDHALSNVAIRQQGLAAIMRYVVRNAPGALQHFGLTQDQLAEKAEAELAIVLHVIPPSPAVAASTSIPVAAVPIEAGAHG